MKIFSRIKSKNRGFWLLLSLVAGGFLGWKAITAPNDYPTSDEFINPANGKADPKFAAFVLPLVSESDDTVFIDIGSAPGDVVKMGVLQYMSPVIRMHPKSRYFKVSWDVSYPNYHVGFTLNYDRQRGIVTEEQNSLNDPISTTVLGRGITDRHIHEGACGGRDYDEWARKHWHQ